MRKKIYIVSASFPYGTSEIFLENEVKYLSKTFDIEIFPIYYYNNTKTARTVPKNVIYYKPFIPSRLIYRMFKSIFVLRFLKVELKELLNLFKKFSFLHFKSYIISITKLRLFYDSMAYKTFLNANKNDIIYFYWSSCLNMLVPNFKSRKFVRIHGGEIDLERNHNYIPYLYESLNIPVTFLLISSGLQQKLTMHNKNANFILNRLGVYNQENLILKNDLSDTINIISCSNLIPLKRVNLIIEALERCVNCNVKWIHFGDGTLLQDIKIMAKNKLKGKVDYIFTGRISNSEIFKFYRDNSFDLFINVSETEGIPVSIMEAMSFGIPCFATNVGGTSEIVNSNNGLLVEKNFQIELLVNAICNSKEPEYRKKRVFAFETWKNYYNANINYNGLTNLFLKSDI